MTTSRDSLSAIAFCWLIERPDGAGLALTSSDRDLEITGIRYRSAPGVTPAAIRRCIGIEPGSAEVAGALSADALTEADLATGRWTGASLKLTAVALDAPGAEPMALFAGELGEVSVEGESFTADLHGAAAQLEREVCPSTSPECRASLGDRQCRVDMAGRKVRAKVIVQQDNLLRLDRAIGEDYLFGRLRFLSGGNCGLATAILSIDGDEIVLRDSPKTSVEQGAVVAIAEGCDKRLETCASRFANAVNFRGEPHLPGTDLLTRYPGV